jgi:hypothetical protein
VLLLGTRILLGTVPVDVPDLSGDLDRAPSPSRAICRKSGIRGRSPFPVPDSSLSESGTCSRREFRGVLDSVPPVACAASFVPSVGICTLARAPTKTGARAVRAVTLAPPAPLPATEARVSNSESVQCCTC